MKHYLDMAGKQVQASKDSEPKVDQHGQQRTEKNTGPPAPTAGTASARSVS